MKKIFIKFLPFAVAITLLSVLVYGAVQQEMRMSANDLPMQIAEDGAFALESGSIPAEIVSHGSPQVDIGTSLAPWLMVLDDKGEVLESSGVLSGTVPQLPAGVLDKARATGENKFTWQPYEDVRDAVVIERAVSMSRQLSAFVVAGHSLRETENHAQTLLLDVAVGWLVTLIGTFIVLAFSRRFLI